MNTQIAHIVTHTRPHLDEAAGIAALRLYRPEIISTGVEYTFMGIGRLGAQSEDERKDESVLYLGVLGGNADEHLPGRENECAATLVAKHYGIFENLHVQVALRPVLRMDRSGAHADEIGAAMIHVARYSGDEDREVLEWGILAVSALFKEAEEVVANQPPAAEEGKRSREPKVSVKTETVIFYVRKHFPEQFKAWAETLERADRGRETERAEADPLAKAAKVHNVGGRKVVVVEGTENREVANASRDLHQHDLIVVLRPSGLVQILTSGRSASGVKKMDLLPLLVSLRRKEMEVRELVPLSLEEEVLPNTPEACPWWFGHLVDDGQRIGSVFNGTQDAALQVEVTKLNRDQILGLVKAFVESLAAEAARPTERRDDRRPREQQHQGQGHRQDRRLSHKGGRDGDRRHHQANGNGKSNHSRRPSPPARHRPQGIVGVGTAFEKAAASA